MTAPLYTTEILRLAMTSAAYPRLAAPDATAEARTPVCGSRITLDLAFDPDGRIAAVGFALHACAIGQAAAGLFAKNAVGRSPAELNEALATLSGWLTGASDDAEIWPDINVLAEARNYPARHPAILLPFQAATQAVSSSSTPKTKSKLPTAR